MYDSSRVACVSHLKLEFNLVKMKKSFCFNITFLLIVHVYITSYITSLRFLRLYKLKLHRESR